MRPRLVPMYLADPAFATVTAHRSSVHPRELRDRIDRGSVVAVGRQAGRTSRPLTWIVGQRLSPTHASMTAEGFEALQTVTPLCGRRLLLGVSQISWDFCGIVERDGDLYRLSRRNVDRLRVWKILAVHPERGA